MNEIRIELDTLLTLYDHTGPTGEWSHRALNHLLETLLVQGGVFRDPAIIVLTDQDIEADFDEELAKRMDFLAQRKIDDARPEPSEVEEE
jgi:hypothetical protein|tara:strand:+ start:313 stop:582 length:270 start_codon:yes stop_codon:yes gene_type:complete